MNADIEPTDDGILVTFTGDFDTVDGWAEAREDLGLNRAGPGRVPGVEIVDQDELYHDEDDAYPYGYASVTLRFDDADALEATSSRLYDKARERFEWGMHSEAEKVQNFAGEIPSEYAVSEAIDA